MTEIIKKQLRAKINNLLEIYQGLKKLQKFTSKDLEKDVEKVWAVTFGLIAGIEAILDISQYILGDKGIAVESYGKIPEELRKAGIIDKKFQEKMQKMIGFRNRAIHNYPSLEEKEVHRILQENVDDFKEFLRITKKA